MKKSISAVFACVGAVIGAGFASGREIMVFFTRYGRHSWWLVLLAGGMMGWLCHLCMRCAKTDSDWPGLFAYGRRWAVLVSCLLMIVTAGAMISAAGHMIALLWVNEWAYAIGAAGTMLMAWLCSFRSLRMMGWISALLSILLVCILAYAIGRTNAEYAVLLTEPTGTALLRAVLFAAAYAAMNMMLAIGVVCRSAGQGRWVPAAVGLVIAGLLGLSNALYSRHPELLDAAFPIVALLNGYGRNGFLLSVILLYLSIFTTQTAVMLALRSAVERYVSSPLISCVVTLGLPLMVSCAGFSGIVDGLYAPAGLICLLTVFAPLAVRQYKHA